MADLTDYSGLITSEHNQRPKFMAVVEALAQPMVDLQNVLGSMPGEFDLDSAVGAQLDAVGEWVGISRVVNTPLTGVYFSFDTAGLGFDQGVWKGPFDPDTGLTRLDDETYRLVLRAKIGANHWDGTLESSKAILNAIFSVGDAPVSIHANAEPFGVGDGATANYQLLYQGQPVYQIDSAALYRADWQGNQLLYPTARTNLLLWSEDATNAAWSKTGCTVTTGIAGPNGSSNAQRVTEDTSTGNHSASQAVSGVTSGGQYTYSAFVKAGSRTQAQVQMQQGSNIAAVVVNLLTGVIVSSGISGGVWTGFSTTVDAVAGAPGWYRISVTANVVGSTALSFRTQLYNGSVSYTGNGTSYLDVFGQKIEAGTLTSYFPSTSSAATVTDYTLGGTGIAQLGVAPVAGAALTWTGDGEIYPSGTYVFIQDNQDMSMTIGVAGKIPSAVFLALLSKGYIPLKPEGVRINFVIVTSVDGGPMFGFDVENQFVAGFDVGAWGTLL